MINMHIVSYVFSARELNSKRGLLKTAARTRSLGNIESRLKDLLKSLEELDLEEQEAEEERDIVGQQREFQGYFLKRGGLITLNLHCYDFFNISLNNLFFQKNLCFFCSLYTLDII